MSSGPAPLEFFCTILAVELEANASRLSSGDHTGELCPTELKVNRVLVPRFVSRSQMSVARPLSPRLTATRAPSCARARSRFKRDAPNVLSNLPLRSYQS